MDNSFDNQIIFKLATIETQVKGIGENLTAAVQRLEDKITQTNVKQTADLAKLETKLNEQEKRVMSLENYRDKLAAKVGGVVSVVAVFWLLFGKVIEQQLVSIF